MKFNKALLISMIGLITLVSCAGYSPDKPRNPTIEQQEAQHAIAQFIERDPGLQAFFDHSYGFAIFPKVGKGAIGIGGAHGDGKVFQQGKIIGETSLTQITIGLQLGGQAFSEVIFFEDQYALSDFTNSRFEFSAQVSAVAATAGASADADYQQGVAVFSMTLGGLMYEASVGGQKFKYYPL